MEIEGWDREKVQAGGFRRVRSGGGAVPNEGACDATRLGGKPLPNARRGNQTPFYVSARATRLVGGGEQAQSRSSEIPAARRPLSCIPSTKLHPPTPPSPTPNGPATRPITSVNAASSGVTAVASTASGHDATPESRGCAPPPLYRVTTSSRWRVAAVAAGRQRAADQCCCRSPQLDFQSDKGPLWGHPARVTPPPSSARALVAPPPRRSKLKTCKDGGVRQLRPLTVGPARQRGAGPLRQREGRGRVSLTPLVIVTTSLHEANQKITEQKCLFSRQTKADLLARLVGEQSPNITSFCSPVLLTSLEGKPCMC